MIHPDLLPAIAAGLGTWLVIAIVVGIVLGRSIRANRRGNTPDGHDED